jgi:hypothetical protein
MESTMPIERLLNLLRAWAVCSVERLEPPSDDLELLLTYYIDLNPSPEVFGELRARVESRPRPVEQS